VLPLGSGVRRQNGPGGGALALIVLAGLLAVLAVVLWIRKPAKRVATVEDAAVADVLDAVEMEADDAAIAEVMPDAAIVAMAPDASVALAADAAVVAPDAAVAMAIDASVPVVGPSDAGADPLAQAKLLYQQAHEANQEGDFQKALELAEASLKLRRTARANIVRAQALQRLGRLEEAISGMESAIRLAPDYPSNYEVLGSILWAAQRYDEAAVHYRTYLERWPNGDKSAMIQKRLDETR
jgi:tetratricopeptide (TPR) repeat protein